MNFLFSFYTSYYLRNLIIITTKEKKRWCENCNKKEQKGKTYTVSPSVKRKLPDKTCLKVNRQLGNFG